MGSETTSEPPTPTRMMDPMLSTVCAFCDRHSHMTIQWARGTREIGDASLLRIAATCDFCEMVSVARVVGGALGVSGTTDMSYIVKALRGHEDDLEWWPKRGVSPEVNDVPESISFAAREAYSSASVNNHMAAVLMARTVVEATAKAKGIKAGTLAAKINALRDQGGIRPAIAEQAHEIRFMGNDMAHGDIDEAPSAEDAEEILALMAEVLAEVFQGPARMQRLREKRLNRS